MFKSSLFRTIAVIVLLVASLLYLAWPWLAKPDRPQEQNGNAPAEQK